MTLVLDSGAVSALAARRSRLAALHNLGQWPPLVPSVVLVECLTGDHRRDHATNRILRLCRILDVSEAEAREGARLRHGTGRAGTITATDAVVVATAATRRGAIVVSSDPVDMRALAEHAPYPVAVYTT